MKKILLLTLILLSGRFFGQDVGICELPLTTTVSPNDLLIIERADCSDPNGTQAIKISDLTGTGTQSSTPLYFVLAATTGSVNMTYSSGTLTAVSNGRLANQDGVKLMPNDSVLFKDQAAKLQNGIYIVLDTGTVSTPAILYRNPNYNTTSAIYPSQINILQGTINAGNYYYESTVNPTVGTSPIVYITGVKPYVPYTNAVANVNLNNKNLTNIATLQSNKNALINSINVGQGGISGQYNTAVGGSGVLGSITLGGGYYNTAMGYNSQSHTTVGSYNTSYGAASLPSNITGNFNTSTGYSSMFYSIAGNNNTANGFEAGYHSLGDGNLFLGYRAGYNETGSNKLYIANDSTSKPLIKGDFSAKTLIINGATTTTLSNSYANTPSAHDNSTKVATTAYVDNAISSNVGIWAIYNTSGAPTFYSTLTLAMSAASSGDVIEMMANVTESTNVTIVPKNGVSLDLNGHTYNFSYSGSATHAFDDGGTAPEFKVYDGIIKRTVGTGYCWKNTGILYKSGVQFYSTVADFTFQNSGTCYNANVKNTNSAGAGIYQTTGTLYQPTVSSVDVFGNGAIYSAGGSIVGGSVSNPNGYGIQCAGATLIEGTRITGSYGTFGNNTSTMKNCIVIATDRGISNFTNVENCNVSAVNLALGTCVNVSGGTYTTTGGAVAVANACTNLSQLTLKNQVNDAAANGANFTGTGFVENVVVYVSNSSAYALTAGSAQNVGYSGLKSNGATTPVHVNITQTSGTTDSYGNNKVQ